MNHQRKLVWAAIACFTAWCSHAEAQSLLQRLGDQISQQLAPLQPPANNPPQPREVVPVPVSARPVLGIRVGPVTDEVARAQRLVVRRGAVIQAIEQGSAADRAGLPLGAVIVALDGRRIDSPDDLVQAIQASRPGQDVELTYYDQNQLARKKVHLAAVPPLQAQPVPLEPIRPAHPLPMNPPTPTTPGAPPATLERELGGDGSRPLLGRIGRALDSLAPSATPAPAVVPADGASAPQGNWESEVRELRQQVAELTRQIELLQQQLSALEKKLAEK